MQEMTTTVWKTEDGRVFTDKAEASAHSAKHWPHKVIAVASEADLLAALSGRNEPLRAALELFGGRCAVQRREREKAAEEQGAVTTSTPHEVAA